MITTILTNIYKYSNIIFSDSLDAFFPPQWLLY